MAKMAKMYDKYNRFTKKAAKIVVKLLKKGKFESGFVRSNGEELDNKKCLTRSQTLHIRTALVRHGTPKSCITGCEMKTLTKTISLVLFQTPTKNCLNANSTKNTTKTNNLFA